MAFDYSLLQTLKQDFEIKPVMNKVLGLRKVAAADQIVGMVVDPRQAGELSHDKRRDEIRVVFTAMSELSKSSIDDIGKGAFRAATTAIYAQTILAKGLVGDTRLADTFLIARDFNTLQRDQRAAVNIRRCWEKDKGGKRYPELENRASDIAERKVNFINDTVLPALQSQTIRDYPGQLQASLGLIDMLDASSGNLLGTISRIGVSAYSKIRPSLDAAQKLACIQKLLPTASPLSALVLGQDALSALEQPLAAKDAAARAEISANLLKHLDRTSKVAAELAEFWKYQMIAQAAKDQTVRSTVSLSLQCAAADEGNSLLLRRAAKSALREITPSLGNAVREWTTRTLHIGDVVESPAARLAAQESRNGAQTPTNITGP